MTAVSGVIRSRSSDGSFQVMSVLGQELHRYRRYTALLDDEPTASDGLVPLNGSLGETRGTTSRLTTTGICP